MPVTVESILNNLAKLSGENQEAIENILRSIEEYVTQNPKCIEVKSIHSPVFAPLLKLAKIYTLIPHNFFPTIDFPKILTFWEALNNISFIKFSPKNEIYPASSDNFDQNIYYLLLNSLQAEIKSLLNKLSSRNFNDDLNAEYENNLRKNLDNPVPRDKIYRETLYDLPQRLKDNIAEIQSSITNELSQTTPVPFKDIKARYEKQRDDLKNAFEKTLRDIPEYDGRFVFLKKLIQKIADKLGIKLFDKNPIKTNIEDIFETSNLNIRCRR